MRSSLSSLVLFIGILVAGCYDSESTGGGPEPREVCGNGTDDDGDSYVDAVDQDCWPADGGLPPVADGSPAERDAGPRPPGDSGPGTPPAPRTVDVRLYWRSDLDLRFAQIQGCRYDGGPCIVDRFVGTDGPCSTEGADAVVCRLANVAVGTRLDFNAYGERSDGSAVWGIGLAGDGTVRSIGTMYVSEDRDRDSAYDVDRTSAVSVVGIAEGGGRNWSYVVGR